MRTFTRLLCAVVFVTTVHGQPPDPLPSWNDGSIKQRIVGFVRTVTDPARTPTPVRVSRTTRRAARLRLAIRRRRRPAR